MDPQDLNRREILKSLVGVTAALLAPEPLKGQSTTQPSNQPVTRDRLGERLPQRRLGRNGPWVTMLGVGGAHIGGAPDDETAQKIIDTAIAGGVRFFDNAQGYSGGRAEERYGMFLTPKYRDSIFLMTKTTASSAAMAQTHLESSLARLKTDYLDLWQMHTIHSPEEVDMRIANGVLDVMLEAKKQGRVRHIGFTGHVTPNAHLRMLERGAERGGASGNVFTSCQMPINLLDPSYNSFVLNFVPKAVEAGVGVLAMKTLSNGAFFGPSAGRGQPPTTAPAGPKLIPDRITVADALSFVWSLPVSVAISGARDPQMIQEKIDLARNFKPLSDARRQELIAKVADLSGTTIENYKIPPAERPDRGGRGRGARGVAPA